MVANSSWLQREQTSCTCTLEQFLIPYVAVSKATMSACSCCGQTHRQGTTAWTACPQKPVANTITESSSTADIDLGEVPADEPAIELPPSPSCDPGRAQSLSYVGSQFEGQKA
jgi:hypothetical protein